MTKDREQLESVRYSKLLQRLTTRDQLLKFVSSIETTHRQLEQELNQYIDTRSHILESRKLELARTELSTSLNTSSDLVSLLGEAGTHAMEITARVRVLDIERERVRETLEYVTDVKQLRNLILATHQAIEVRDYTVAAGNLNQIISKLRLEGQFIDAVVPSTDVPETPNVVVNRWVKELTEVFTREFIKASEARDVENLTFFFRLFPLLGKASVGLDCYSKFICDIISSQSRLIINNQQSQQQQDKMGFFPLALTRLLEIISKMINQHAPIITKYYGSQYMIDIIEKVEKETDSQAGLIADTFCDHRSIERTLKEIDNYKFQPITNQIIATSKTTAGSNSGSQPNSSRPSMDGGSQPRSSEDYGVAMAQINDLLLELSNFCKYWGMYCKFVAVKWNEYLHLEVKDEEGLRLPPPIVNSKFSVKLQSKITPALERFLEFFMKKSLNQSFTMEELPKLNPFILAPVSKQQQAMSPESAPASSIAEDLTLILTSVFKLAIESAQPLTLSKTITMLKRLIKEDYLLVIVKRLKELYPRQGTALSPINVSTQPLLTTNSNLNKQSTMNSFFQRGASALTELTKGDDEERLHYFLLYLNTLSVSGGYFDKIVSFNCQLINAHFTFGTDAKKLNNNLIISFEENLKEEFSMVVRDHLNILFNQCFKAKLQSLVSDFFRHDSSDTNSSSIGGAGSATADMKPYLISSFSDHDSSSSSSSLSISNFMRQWTAIITPYLKVLDSKNYDALLSLIISHISLLLEMKIWSLDQNINELGAIKLEREISLMISELTKGRYHLRENFIKVTQIIMILGLGDDEDELELNWVLTPMERSKARRLRVDR